MNKKITIVTTDNIPGKKVGETLGMVQGNTVKARNIGRDIFAGLRNLIGGEIKEYTKLLSAARKEAVERMSEEARKLDADAVINVRFTTSSVMHGCSEILAYGTAVKLVNSEHQHLEGTTGMSADKISMV